jgi:hypothetical protein
MIFPCGPIPDVGNSGINALGKDPLKADAFRLALEQSGVARYRPWANRDQLSTGNGKMASGNDMEAARETYGGFIHLVKYGTIAVALITILVVGLIA